MTFIPIDRMWERVQVARQDSDTELFNSLLYFGEMLCKIVAAGLASAIHDDRDRHRYRQIHRLVRADSLGEWAAAIEDMLTGPASQFLTPTARTEQRELTQKCKEGSWQYDAVSLLSECLKQVTEGSVDTQGKIDARRWFSVFVQLRNDTRGHGVVHGTDCAGASPALEQSIRLLCENFNLFKRQWAYLHRKLSGEYRVTRLSQTGGEFDSKKLTSSLSLEDGVYVFLDAYRRVELIRSDAEASDFWFPNGAFNGKRFESISYVTGSKTDADAAPYLAPATELPPSQTEGTGLLDAQGRCFGNLPPMPTGYVNRTELESELLHRLCDDRHGIVTLHGSGGVGKTSLALAVLHQLTQAERFEAVVWFSARDIDLLTEGPRLVKPHVLTETEIAREFVGLMQPSEAGAAGFEPLKYLSGALTSSPIGKPILFVFDNFETVRSPAELFVWADTYLRQPNKVLITTRFRDFKGDYPVEVFGMSEDECKQLCDEAADALGIRKLLTSEYRRELYKESGGHPYVIKILLGEVAKAGQLKKIERIIAGRDEILDALFERTFAGLSPAAKQVFLTLSNWRSTIPEFAVEAVMLRPSNERLDVEAALDELKRSSFVETTVSADKNVLLSVPLVAAVFGKRKLAVSPMKIGVEANTEILRFLGAAQKSDTRRGVGPRIHSMFSNIAAKASKSPDVLNEYAPILEFVAQRYPPAWLLLARLFEEADLDNRIDRARSAIERYLESTARAREQMYAWQKRSEYCRQVEDWHGEVQSQVEIGTLPDMPFTEISNAANRVNSALRFHQFLDIYEINVLTRKLVDTMASRIDAEGDATDCSRLAWLHLRLGNEGEADRLIDQGLTMEPTNEYCGKLKEQRQHQRSLFQ
jgi:NB-ARC domain